MVIDLILTIFLILAMFAGYLGGGFKEILKLIVFIALFVAFKIPSLESAMKEFAGPSLYASFYIILFLLSYFAIYWLLFLVLKNIVKEKEGHLGGANRVVGVIAGLFKGFFVIFVMIYILESLLKRDVFIELRPYVADSMFYVLIKNVLNKLGLVFY